MENKYQKSLDRIKKNLFLSDLWTEEDKEHYFTIIEAIEKQIPTRPTVSYHKYIDADTNKEGSYHLTHCPCCFFDNHLGYFESLIDKGTAFCHRCGQAIDWEEGEADA